MAGEEIEPARLLAGARAAAEGAELLVCEGVGGFLVPLAGDYLVRDLARELGPPVVIVAHRPSLGTINHTLLTLESVRAAGLEASAVVLTPWAERPSRMEGPTARRSPGWARCPCAPSPGSTSAEPGALARAVSAVVRPSGARGAGSPPGSACA